ncbi:hypothetical protein RIR_jg33388.t1 [Rhizophagus irregularis DAOM 181602=DAOM 197198]|nr:hypothetical protein RIR_jg33388.t1 [Rhizophagus irregularis DAOM 181602=DAOM 197198]
MVMQNEEDTVIVKNIDAGMYVIENKHTIIEIRSIYYDQSFDILSKKNNNIVDVTTDVGDDKETSGGRKNLNRNKEVISITKVNQIQRVKSWNRFVNNSVPTVSNTEVKIQLKEKLTQSRFILACWRLLVKNSFYKVEYPIILPLQKIQRSMVTYCFRKSFGVKKQKMPIPSSELSSQTIHVVIRHTPQSRKQGNYSYSDLMLHQFHYYALHHHTIDHLFRQKCYHLADV